MSSDASQPISFSSRFKTASSTFDINAIEKHSALCETLDEIAADLGKDSEARIQLGKDDGVWSDIHKLWRDLVHAQLTFWDGDDSDDGEDDGSIKERRKKNSLTELCVSLARFTRNLVAGVPSNQIKAFGDEPVIRRLLHYYTSWTSMEDEKATFAARILTQMLSNIITGNEPLISSLWDTYLNLKEDQVVLIRLLASPDNRILLAVLTLISSCVHESRTRTKMLARSAVGARICVMLLDNMVRLYDADEASDGARAFDVGYSIFTRIIESGLIPDLYTKLSISDEIVTPHQTILLKLLDSYLQSAASISFSETKTNNTKIHTKLCPMLSNLFFSLSAYAQTAIRKSLGSSASDYAFGTTVDDLHPPAELDVLLPKVCEALVLVTQCIVTIVLDAQYQHHGSPGSGSSASHSSHEDSKTYFNQVYYQGSGLAESLVVLLRLVDRFLPRINFGRPVASTGKGVASTNDFNSNQSLQDNPGFNYLKRDLVRLLGILCNEDKAVQDRLRKCGGIEVVMNLCVVDERNPYLREHAIFALHNLLKDNAANQAVVEEIKPMGRWDADGILRDAPGAVRKALS